MTDSWDWIERQRRRQHRGKLLPSIVLFAIIAYAFYALDRASILSDIGLKSTSTESSKSSVEPSSSRNRHDVLLPGETTNSSNDTKELQNPPRPNLGPSESSVRIPEPSIPAPSIVDRTQTPDKEFELPDDGQTRRSSDSFESKYQQLEQLVSKLDANECVGELLKFRSGRKEISPIRLANILGHVTARQWLELAESEIEKASPDSYGFAEVWLPVASVWSILGNVIESREAMRRVRKAIPRMTNPERQVEMVIDLVDHELFDRRLVDSLFNEAVATAAQVGDRFPRRTCYAHLSGLASVLGKQSDAASLLEIALDPEKNAHISTKIHRDDLLIFEAKAASWSKQPESIEYLASELERMNGPHQEQFGLCYAYAALAAIRNNDMKAFFRTMFKAESAFSTEKFRSNHSYNYVMRFGEAYLKARQWQNAVIVANNIPDPNLQASILFRVLAESPQHVPSFNLPNLFDEFGDGRWGTYGIASYVEHRLRLGDDALDLLEWIRALENPALRGAAYTGVARSADVIGTPLNPERELVRDIGKPDIAVPRSLVERAQGIASKLDDPVESATGWLEVARTWRLSQREKSYQDAISSFHDCCFAAWVNIWKQRPPASRGYDGSYHDDYSRRHAVEQDEIARLIECERHLAELQVELGDTDGALYTCLRIANHAGFIDKPVDYVNWQFTFLESVMTRIRDATGIRPEVLLPRHILRDSRTAPFVKAMALAWTSETTRLKSHIEQMRAREKADAIGRSFAELAIVYAQSGDIEGYRGARRAAFSEFNRSQSSAPMKSVLAVADAIAGEFALAKDNIVEGEVAWFDGRARPRSLIAVGLANAGSWEDAVIQAQAVSVQSPFYRSQAWRAVAQSRFQKATESEREGLLAWVDSLENPIDQIAAFCGLALSAEATSR